MSRRKRRAFTPEFKTETARLVRESGHGESRANPADVGLDPDHRETPRQHAPAEITGESAICRTLVGEL